MRQFCILQFIFGLIFAKANRIYYSSGHEDPTLREDDESYGYLPELTFIPKWPTLNTSKELGPVSAAAVLEGGEFQTYILHRDDRYWDETTFDGQNRYQWQSRGAIKDGVLALLKNGKLERKYLANLLHLPHGLTVDHAGNVWITDVAMHQVFKIKPDLSAVDMVLGEQFVPGNDVAHFCKPTSVAVAKNGDFFVADGYCNQRILKFHSDGTFVTQWGRPNNFDEGLLVPHQLALVEDLDLICVADRENHRVNCYTAGLIDPKGTGSLQFEVRTKGPVYGLAFDEHSYKLLALLGPSHGSIQLIDITLQKLIGHVDSNFGEAHTLATCPPSFKSGCLIVCSTEPRSFDFQEPLRRLWLYKLE